MTATAPPTPAPGSQTPAHLVQMIEQVDETHQAAHKRLRETLVHLADKVESNFNFLRDASLANKARIDHLATTPVDATKLVLAPRVVLLIVTLSLTVAGGVWASTAGLRSDVRDILTRMEAQTRASEASGKLQELQAAHLKTAVDDMKRRQELQQYEIQQLKEVILTGKARTP